MPNFKACLRVEQALSLGFVFMLSIFTYKNHIYIYIYTQAIQPYRMVKIIIIIKLSPCVHTSMLNLATVWWILSTYMSMFFLVWLCCVLSRVTVSLLLVFYFIHCLIFFIAVFFWFINKSLIYLFYWKLAC